MDSSKLFRPPGPKAQALTALLLAVSWALPASKTWAQILPGSEAGAEAEEVHTEILLPAETLADAWVEVTPLAAGPEPVFETFPALGDSERRLQPDLPIGPALLCSGARDHGVHCAPFFHYRGPADDFRGELEVAATFVPGRPVSGEIRQRAFPVEGAEVRVVPAGLTTLRPFTLPLAPGAGDTNLQRAVTTDPFGRFETLAIAPGVYFLEIHLPTGRLFRGSEFTLEADPDEESTASNNSPSAARLDEEPLPTATEDTASAQEDPEPHDLGRIDIEEGLALEVHLRDPAEAPVSQALVEARQGHHVQDLVSYEQYTDSNGEARLAGFTVEQPLILRLGAPGFRAAELVFETLPARVDGILEPLATLQGAVLASEGEAAVGARVSLHLTQAEPAVVSFPEADETTSVPATETLDPMATDEDGSFRFTDLVAGEYELEVAALGHAVYRSTLRIDPGESLWLDPIALLAGREVNGQVLDKNTREGLPGVSISTRKPAGAVEAESGADGIFQFLTASEQPLELLFTAEGHAELLLHLHPEQLAEDQPLEVELEPAGWILATVADGTEAQAPCQGCRLLLAPGERTLTTDPQGEALSRPLAPGSYQLQRPAIFHLGSTSIEQTDAEIRDVRVTAGEITTVRFGEPRAAVSLAFDPPWDPSWSLVLRAPGRSERVLPDADGRFSVARRTGESPRLFARFFDPVAGRDAEIYQGDLPAVIPEDELVIPRHPTRFRGRVRVDGDPRPGLRLQVLDLAGETLGTLWTGADGTFSASHLPTGVYSLQVEDRAITFVSLRSGLDLDLGTFDLPSGSF